MRMLYLLIGYILSTKTDNCGGKKGRVKFERSLKLIKIQ